MCEAYSNSTWYFEASKHTRANGCAASTALAGVPFFVLPLSKAYTCFSQFRCIVVFYVLNIQGHCCATNNREHILYKQVYQVYYEAYHKAYLETLSASASAQPSPVGVATPGSADCTEHQGTPSIANQHQAHHLFPAVQVDSMHHIPVYDLGFKI